MWPCRSEDCKLNRDEVKYSIYDILHGTEDAEEVGTIVPFVCVKTKRAYHKMLELPVQVAPTTVERYVPKFQIVDNLAAIMEDRELEPDGYRQHEEFCLQGDAGGDDDWDKEEDEADETAVEAVKITEDKKRKRRQGEFVSEHCRKLVEGTLLGHTFSLMWVTELQDDQFSMK